MEKIWQGYYLRFDGKLTCVLGTIANADTGERYVVCRQETAKGKKYYVVGRKSFLEELEIEGEKVPKYRRCSKSRAVSEVQARRIYEEGGEYPPDEAIKRGRKAQVEPYANEYAKRMCESYLRDLRMCESGRQTGVEYRCAMKNVALMDKFLCGSLREYAGYFRERFVEGLSIRGYAQKHGINRGSVAYMQKKFFAALAACLSAEDAFRDL